MKLYSLPELLDLARSKSPFYQQSFAHLPTECYELKRFPVLNQTDFWNANQIEDNKVLTGSIYDGILFKSGGTTGQPKFSVFTHEEWKTFTEIFGHGMAQGGLKAGDRVANLFYSGELYASFAFIMNSLEHSSVPVMHFPIAGAAPAAVLKILQDFRVDVIAGVPTSILQLGEYWAAHVKDYPDVRVKKVLIGGESMYPDQRQRLKEIFPFVEIRSVGYASVDAGLLGYADDSCGIDEHRTFTDATILEIINEETNELITESHQPGKLLLTNLTRSLMPVIRYPVGDRAMWLEPEGTKDRKFVLLGRSEEAARVGPVSVYYEDVRQYLQDVQPTLADTKFASSLHLGLFQLLLNHFDMKDELTIRLVANPGHGRETVEQLLLKAFDKFRPMFAETVQAGLIHPLNIEWIAAEQLETNSRTGKTRRVIDQRGFNPVRLAQ